jgi:hypothetical protein
VGPWDPNWRPDPTGRRLAAIRSARRGALASAVIFGIIEVVATVVAPPVAPPTLETDLLGGIAIALFSLPGIALLGAGLSSAALGSRSSATAAGVAMGLGVPVAAVTSAMIGAFFYAWFVQGAPEGLDAAGQILRGGVTSAVRIWPLIVIGSVAWVLLVRRLEPRA